jgi:hypothetical protein
VEQKLSTYCVMREMSILRRSSGSPEGASPSVASSLRCVASSVCILLLKAGSRILMCVTRMLFSLFARYEVPTCIIAYVCE